MEFETYTLTVITTVATALTALFAVLIFVWGLRQRQFDILEQSFDVLQRVNEKGLESDENVAAVIKSGNPDDPISTDDARELLFHYMRINRMFRAYEYHRGFFITKKQRDRIINTHTGTLKPIWEKLPAVLDRGYPPDFKDFLIKRVKASEVPKLLS